MTKKEKTLKLKKSVYLRNAITGALIPLTSIVTALVGSFISFGGYLMLQKSFRLDNLGLMVLGWVLIAWAFLFGPWIAIRCYRRAKAIRLAMKSAGTWSKTK